MPLTVTRLLKQIRRPLTGRVGWGGVVPLDQPGIYVVSLSGNPTRNEGVLAKAPLSSNAIEGWLKKVPRFTLNGKTGPTPNEVASFLSGFWLPDESIVYIGKATSLSKRIAQMYSHRLGKRTPHGGGHWLKTLACLDSLHVYFSRCPSPDRAREAESKALECFVAQVSPGVRMRLLNADLPLPFANRLLPGRGRKETSIRNAVLR